MYHLNWLDYGIILVIVFSVIISLIRGFLREALSLAAWIIAFWVGLTFSKSFSQYLQPYLHSPGMRYAAAFIILFLGTLLIGAIVNSVISRLVEKTGLSGTDRLIGLVFGFARGVLLVAIVLVAARLTDFDKTSQWQQSQLVPVFVPVENWLAQYVPKDVHSDFDFKQVQPPESLATKTAIIKKSTNDVNMLNQQGN